MEDIKKAITELLTKSRGTEGITFRPLHVEDAEEIYGMFNPEEVYERIHWRPASMEDTHRLIRTWLAEKTEVHLMIESDGETCGLFRMNAFSPGQREIWLSLIIVKPERQNKGLGGAAIRQALNALKESGTFDRVKLGVDANDHAAVRCFKSAGFKTTERTAKKYSNIRHPIKRLIMTRELE